jgi:hypothetical protein
MNDITTDITVTNEAPHNTEFLVSLATALLKDKRQTWSDMNEIAEFCKAHALRLNNRYPNADELESILAIELGPTGEFIGDGLTLEGYSRKVEWELVFMVRAYLHHIQPANNLIDESTEAFAITNH